jgi:hypothetical protein
VTIGPNLQIKKDFDDLLKTFVSRPAVFLRRLVFESGIFTLEDVAACSIGGKRSFTSPEAVRAALNPTVFKALKGYYFH